MCDSNIRIEWLFREHIYIRSAMDMDMDMDMNMDMDMDISKYIWTRYMPVPCVALESQFFKLNRLSNLTRTHELRGLRIGHGHMDIVFVL